MINELQLGRNGSHRYNITPAQVCFPLAPRLKKNGELAKVQPKGPKPKFDTTSVTTISGMIEKPGLVWGAAKETAHLAVNCRREWMHLNNDQAFTKLRTHFRRVWDLKGQTGDIVHAVALDWAHGRESDIEYLLTFDEKDRERNWSDEERNEVRRRVMGCVDALELFYLEQRPKWHLVEQTVIHPSSRWRPGDEYKIDRKTCYAGAFDGDCETRDEGLIKLDFKTGGRWLDSTTLQLTGLKYCRVLPFYDDEGHMIGWEPYESPKKCATVQLHDDGTYELLVLPTNRDSYRRFMGLRRHHGWLTEMRAWEKDHPDPYLENVTDSDEIEQTTQTTEREAA